MKLDRNITTPRRGKYALIKLRDSTITPHLVTAAKACDHAVEVEPKAIDFGDSEDSDFFVIRLKDKYAATALMAYAVAAKDDDEEYGRQVLELAIKAFNHPSRRRPD